MIHNQNHSQCIVLLYVGIAYARRWEHGAQGMYRNTQEKREYCIHSLYFSVTHDIGHTLFRYRGEGVTLAVRCEHLAQIGLACGLIEVPSPTLWECGEWAQRMRRTDDFEL